MFRLVICIILIISTVTIAQIHDEGVNPKMKEPASTRTKMIWEDIYMPWGNLRPAITITDIIDELALPQVSGIDMAAEVKAFQDLWDKHLEERKTIATELAKLAQKFEKVDEFDKALILYEKIWEVFPEQLDLIGRIKWEHATEEVEIDLSNPEKAFISLKRALLTYKLTAATFGLADASTILYEPMPIELSDTDERLRRKLQMGLEENNWPKPEPNAWLEAARYGMVINRIDLEVEDATKLDVMELLKNEYGVPLALTPAARHTLAKDKKRLTFEFKNIPLRELLRHLLKYNESDIRLVERAYSLLVYNRRYDKPNHLITAVLQSEPCGIFPDEKKRYDESYSKEARAYLEDFLGDVLGIDKFPDEWETYFGDVGMFKAPIEAIGAWYNIVTIPSAGEYYGRTHPLLRCLRAYPLVGPAVDRYEGHPRKRYQYMVQVDLQTQRMQRFLSDRLKIIALLKSELQGVKEHAKNRYDPDISSTSRVGLWFDGNNYRFLIFDSGEERDRWLNGEDWVDIPSDIDKLDWPTDEEWQTRLEEWNEKVSNEEKAEKLRNDPERNLEELKVLTTPEESEKLEKEMRENLGKDLERIKN